MNISVSGKPVTLTRETLHILRPFWLVMSLATITGIVSGFATTQLLAEINRALHAGQFSTSFWLSFAALLLVGVVGSSLAGTINSFIGQKMIARMRKELSARILQAPIGAIEAFRPHKILASLNNDVDTLSAFTFNLAGYTTNFAIAVAGIGYLFYLSPLIFAVAFLFLLSGMLLTGLSRRVWIRDYEDVRMAQDGLQKHYRAIIEGAKELRLHRLRRSKVYHQGLSEEVDRIARLKSHAMTWMWVTEGAAAALFFIAIGLMLAGREAIDSSQTTIGASIIILLYIKSPFEQLAGALAVADQARIALRHLTDLAKSFHHAEPDIVLIPSTIAVDYSITSLELRNVVYHYAAGNNFRLGPVSFTLQPGEITFIVGENGSGKTTIIKLLLGLYDPQQGEIILNGTPVAPGDKDNYRQLFSTVFADYFLFDDIVHEDISPEKIEGYLDKLKLSGKVTVVDNQFTTTDLSTGQRKRLALLHAWLDDRPVIIFDEWAADQDPAFRHLFYNQFLPELKARGKVVVVISHDDRYFSMADRVIHLQHGKVTTQ